MEREKHTSSSDSTKLSFIYSITTIHYGRCWINIKSKKLGLFSDGINLFKGGFYQKQPNGSYKKFKPEYITFPYKKS